MQQQRLRYRKEACIQITHYIVYNMLGPLQEATRPLEIQELACNAQFNSVLFLARYAQGLGMRQTPQQNLAAEQQFHNDTTWVFIKGQVYE